MTPQLAGLWLWILFMVSWWAAAFWTAPAIAPGAARQRIGYLIGWAIGFSLLFSIPPALVGASARVRFGLGNVLPAAWQAPAWHVRTPVGWALAAAMAAGFCFAWWARLHLGRLWSSMMTLREGHRVVDSGPYALVRHPIYTGFLLASWGFALLLPGVAQFAGALVLSLVMVLKSGSEERLLRRELGAAAYDDYAARTPMLIPFAPR